MISAGSRPGPRLTDETRSFILRVALTHSGAAPVMTRFELTDVTDGRKYQCGSLDEVQGTLEALLERGDPESGHQSPYGPS